MSGQLQHTVFQNVFFPVQQVSQQAQNSHLTLNKVYNFSVAPQSKICDLPLVIFDFETTGFSSEDDRIIEVGGIKVMPCGDMQEFAALINPGRPLPQRIQEITGLTDTMLAGKPAIDEVMPDFLQFIDGAVLVAHNADFDYHFLKDNCQRLGFDMSWACFCTLKLSRVFLPQLPNRTLDTLAQHYGLSFDARHRSIGDCKVTLGVLRGMLANEAQSLTSWDHLSSYCVS